MPNRVNPIPPVKDTFYQAANISRDKACGEQGLGCLAFQDNCRNRVCWNLAKLFSPHLKLKIASAKLQYSVIRTLILSYLDFSLF